MTDTENKTIELKDEELDTVVGGIFFLEKENQAKTPVKVKNNGGAIYNKENSPNMREIIAKPHH